MTKIVAPFNFDPDDPDNNIPLMLAACKGDLAICKRLVKDGADVNAVNCHGLSILMVAIECGHLEVCRFLLENNARLNRTHICGIGFGNSVVFRVNAVSDHELSDGTPLIQACLHGHLHICEFLVEHGANTQDYKPPNFLVRVVDGMIRSNPSLHRKYRAIREFLVKQGANVDAKAGISSVAPESPSKKQRLACDSYDDSD
eukprot:COSAG01_NODE_4229_length_5223_cov_118.477752_1_plen_200_part_10